LTTGDLIGTIGVDPPGKYTVSFKITVLSIGTRPPCSVYYIGYPNTLHRNVYK